MHEAMHLITLALLLSCLGLLLAVLVIKAWRENDRAGGRAVAHASAALSVPSFRQSDKLVGEELTRARRYEHPLSLVTLSLDGNGDSEMAGDSLQERVRQLAFGLVGPAWRDGLRSSDLITFDPTGNRYVVLLAESDRQQAERCIERLLRTSVQRPIPRLHIGVAQFPEDSTTLDGLLKVAEQTATNGPAPTVSGQTQSAPLGIAR